MISLFQKKLLFLLLSLCLCACSTNSTSPSEGSKNVQVTFMTIKPQDTPVDFDFIAQTQSSRQVDIQARVNGFLDRRVYTEGQKVKEGQILFIMDKKPFEAQLSSAKAALQRQIAAMETAKLNLNRTKPLAELNALSQKDLDNATGSYQSASASVEQAKAQLEIAELNLSYCTITSPLDGVTSSALQQEGSYLDVANSKLTTVSALSPMWVNFSLSENQLQSIQDQKEKGLIVLPKNNEFIVKIVQSNGELYPHLGKITFAEPYFNPQTGTFLIRASVENPNDVLMPNQYVHAVLVGAIRPNAITVPQTAVQQSTKGSYVWILNQDNKAMMQPVILGNWNGNNWFINQGLKAGDRVVVDGMIHLSQDQLVEPTEVTTEVKAK